eukprot:TRINITY_DN1158_c0_g1_i1.p1 TRINITY_DN1158_c0_g1~~TRINITY_DN1158_c0_g1_i1.p1  ORF type:complete len:183 (-),score=32.70 TRINITY_DN1158_c0_g1_i1:140-688(-)
MSIEGRQEIQYPTKSGDTYTFDQNSEKVKECSGFFPGERVHTPRGFGKVIGWNGGHVWIHVDGDQGASYWSNCRNSEEFEKKDIYVVDKFNKAIKRPLQKKFLIEHQQSAKVVKLEFASSVEEFHKSVGSVMNFDLEKEPFRIQYWSSEFNQFVDLDNIQDLKNEKTAKLKLERLSLQDSDS